MLSSAVSAQDNSPYTRFGVGELHSQSPASLRAWGDVSAAFQDPYRFTITNPASLGSLDRTTLQAGIVAKGLRLETQDTTAAFGNAMPDYLTLAFSPLNKKWGLSLGLLSYSRVNYSVYQLNEAGNGLPKSVNAFDGNGGLYEAYIGGGISVGKFSVGLKGAYLFGNINNRSQLIFDDTLNGFNTLFSQLRVFSGFTWNAGMQYYVKLPGNNRLQFGLDGHTALNVTAKRDYLYERFFYDGGVEIPKDTIQSAFKEKGTVTLPMAYDAGIIYKHYATEKSDFVRWQAGLNVSQVLFDDYRSFGERDSLTNSFKVSVGGEWIPKEEAIEGYLNRVRYRAGAYYGSGGIKLRNQTLTQYGFTVGLGLPIRRSSFIDLSADFGVNGTTDEKLIREKYIRGTIGFLLSDVWFVPRRYD